MSKWPCETCYFHMSVSIHASLDGPAEDREWCEVTGKLISSYPKDCPDYVSCVPDYEAYYREMDLRQEMQE